MSVDPVALALLRPPGEAGADIVVGEGQGLGNHLNFGGPYLGLFSCRKELVRRMPGRLVGATVDTRRQARVRPDAPDAGAAHPPREGDVQHLHERGAHRPRPRRSTLALLGKEGLRRAATLSTAKAHYAAEALGRVPGVSPRFPAPFFKEFALRLPKNPGTRAARASGGAASWAASRSRQFDRKLKDCILVAVTERRTRAEIDAYAEALASAVA